MAAVSGRSAAACYAAETLCHMLDCQQNVMSTNAPPVSSNARLAASGQSDHDLDSPAAAWHRSRWPACTRSWAQSALGMQLLVSPAWATLESSCIAGDMTLQANLRRVSSSERHIRESCFSRVRCEGAQDLPGRQGLQRQHRDDRQAEVVSGGAPARCARHPIGMETEASRPGTQRLRALNAPSGAFGKPACGACDATGLPPQR